MTTNTFSTCKPAVVSSANNDEVKIEYKLDTLSGGGIIGKFINNGNPRDMLRVKNATNALRRLVEAQFPHA